jgi:hypothetical protein
MTPMPTTLGPLRGNALGSEDKTPIPNANTNLMKNTRDHPLQASKHLPQTMIDTK